MELDLFDYTVLWWVCCWLLTAGELRRVVVAQGPALLPVVWPSRGKGRHCWMALTSLWVFHRRTGMSLSPGFLGCRDASGPRPTPKGYPYPRSFCISDPTQILSLGYRC